MIPALPATRPLWLSATHYYSAETEVVACFPLSAAGAAEWQPPDAAQPAQALSASVATPAGFGAGVGLARAAVALAATVAHPQGGGQPGDCGLIVLRGARARAQPPPPPQPQPRLALAFHTARKATAGDAVLHFGVWCSVAAGAGGSDGEGAEDDGDGAQWQALADGAGGALASARVTPLSVAAAEAALEAVASGGSNGGGLQRTGVAVPCSVYISAPQRRLAARLHSAGHLLDLAVRSVVADLQPTVPLVASKGYHFPDGPWVEYEGALASTSPAAFQAAVQQACQPLLAADVPTTVREVDAAGCVAAGLAPGDIAHLPAGTSVRIVAVGDASNVCPCGGTHVERAGEIGALVVTKVSSKKGKTRVCYEVSA